MKHRFLFSTLVLIAAGSSAIAQSPARPSSTRSGTTPTSASLPSPPPVERKVIEVTDALVTLIDDVRVPAQEAGRLMKVHVKGGEAIDQDFVLAEIDNRDTLAKEKIAQAELAVADEQANSTAELEAAQKAADVAKAEADSLVEIRDKNPGAVSLTELRRAKFQHERALAQIKVAQTDLSVAKLTTGVKAAQLEATANELARRQISAPFGGEVNEVFRQVGEWVQPGEAILHLVRFDKVRVKGFVYAQTAAPADVLGKPVKIRVDAAGGKEEVVEGTVAFASSVIEGVGDTRQFRIWAEVDNKKALHPVTKKEVWVIQPGTSAIMEIDVTPPVLPKPATPAKTTPAGFRPRTPGTPTPGNSTSGASTPTTQPGSTRPVSNQPGTPKPEVKVESFKPVAEGEKKPIVAEPKTSVKER
jgi:multidrug efflux pump subunit AcrA (membrane-fusion protein)